MGGGLNVKPGAAIRNNLTVATGNEKDFRRPGVKLFNPFEEPAPQAKRASRGTCHRRRGRRKWEVVLGSNQCRGFSMAAFQREVLVRFGHCDAAGWVFYPRYFEMISDFVEDWFEDGLEASAPGLFHHKQLLTPSVHFTVDFPRPTKYGDRLTFKLWTTKVGRTSCEIRIEASFHGEVRMQVRQVLVFITATSGRPTLIPPEVASRMR